MAYNTNNPVPSSDPRDLFDNAESFDQGMNSTADTFRGRRGQNLYTWSFFHRMTANALAQINVTIGTAQAAVNGAAAAAISEMEATAAALGDDLNNKHYLTYAEMIADPQPRDAVVAVVDGDPDQNLNGWYSWDLSGSSWVRFQDQPVQTSSADRLFKALDEQMIPDVAWSVGDNYGSRPLRLRSDGVTEADSFATEKLSLQTSEFLEGQSIPKVVYAILDALNSSPFFIKDDGTASFVAVDALKVMVKGVDIIDSLKANSAAKSGDMVMGPQGLIPMYADMQKISGWGSSSLERMSAFISQMFSEIAPDATYYNGAQGGETSRDTAGRLGSIPMLITVPGGEIPASGAITVTCSNVANNQFLLPFTGSISGVPGTLSNDGSKFTFTRSQAGAVQASPENTPFIPDIGPTYRDGVTLLWMGKNDFATETVESIVSRTNTSFDYLTQFVKRILVFGHFADRDSSGAMIDKIKQANAFLYARYGASYVDSMAYIGSAQVWIDTGVTPTSADIAAQAASTLPPSLTTDGIHFNAALNSAFVGYLKNKLINLGWF